MLARRPARRSAFTIVELMVVMAIVLMLAAILVPSLMGFWGNNRTKAAGRPSARGGRTACAPRPTASRSASARTNRN